MHAERAPILGIAVAVLVLVAECVGLFAYKQAQQPRTESAQERKIKLLRERLSNHSFCRMGPSEVAPSSR